MNTTTDRALLLSTGSLKNTKIVNLDGEDLGKLEEIMLHVDGGDVAYAVVSFGGFLGMGDKHFAVPWESLTVDTEEHRIVLDVDRERLESAPGFAKDEWPTTAESGWMTDLFRHYGATYRPRNDDRNDRNDFGGLNDRDDFSGRNDRDALHGVGDHDGLNSHNDRGGLDAGNDRNDVDDVNDSNATPFAPLRRN